MIENNISQIRKNKGLTLSQLAARANVSKSYLSTIERHINQNPSFHIIQKIANALEVDVHTLVGAQRHQALCLDHDWVDFIIKIKSYGVEKKHLHDLKKMIEFAEWEHKNDCGEKTEK